MTYPPGAPHRRVLRPGGVFSFNVWDKIEENEFADTVTRALGSLFPDDPPRFLARTPYAYNDRERISRDAMEGGADRPPDIETVSARSRAASFEARVALPPVPARTDMGRA